MNRELLGSRMAGGASQDPYPVGGSVRRARERAQMALPANPNPPRSLIAPESVGSSSRLLNAHSVANEPFQYPRRPQETSSNHNPSISRPKVIPQWPLMAESDSAQPRDPNSADEVLREKGSPPQRPPRPSYVPAILDTSRLREHTPVYQYRDALSPQSPDEEQKTSTYWERNYPLSPSQESGTLGTAYSGSSRPSTSSSAGSIPDFPIPAIPALPPLQPTRRGAALGPPPSSRRGASSYYSQSSYVTPIPEEAAESIKPSHSSYASSHAMPTSWDDGSPESYVLDEDEEEDTGDFEDARSSRSGEPDESTTLVRKTSLGTSHKPSLTTIKDGETVEKSASMPTSGSANPNLLSRTAAAAANSGGEFSSGLGDVPEGKSRSGHADTGKTGFLQAPSRSNGSTNGASAGSANVAGSASQPPMDPRVRQILGGLEKGGAIKSGTPSPITSPSSESITKIKRPHQLNPQVNDPDARGSLTSLPDLIRRATKLASNLDRGKTASRLGLFDMLNVTDPKMEKSDQIYEGRVRSGSITNMLASFPTPALNSTPGSARGGPTSRWPSPFANADGLGQQSSITESKADVFRHTPRRRCCGMPVWVFVLLMIILLILIAAAIIVPVTLIVLPRQNANNANNAVAADLSHCQASTPCANGGTSLVSGNSCSCVCANGFTGTQCGQHADVGCTTINVDSGAQSALAYRNATVGNSIPRLLSASKSNFSIPLNYTAILSAFSSANLSCTSENALINFNGASQRRDLHLANYPSYPLLEVPSATLAPRAPQDAEPTNPALSSNGIVFAGTTTASQASPTPLATATGSSPTHSASPTASSNGDKPITQVDLDFARVAVLFILQEASLDSAIAAQQNLQTVLIGTTFQAGTVDVGSNITVDFAVETIQLANGTIVGRTTG